MLWWVFTTAGRSFQLKRFQTTVEVYFRLCTQTVSFLFWLLLAAIKANIMFYDLFHRKRVYISYNRVNSSVFVTVILDWRDLSKFLFATWGRLFFMLLFRKKEEKKRFYSFKFGTSFSPPEASLAYPEDTLSLTSKRCSPFLELNVASLQFACIFQDEMRSR